MQIPGGKHTTQLNLEVGCDACGGKLATVKLSIETADPEQLQDITRRVQPTSYELRATCSACDKRMSEAGSAAYSNPPDGVEPWRAQSEARDAEQLKIQIENGLAESPVEEPTEETIEEPVAV